MRFVFLRFALYILYSMKKVRTENLSVHNLWIELYNLCNMRFYIILSLLYDPEVDDAAWQCASFDQYPFAVAHSRESHSSVSYLVYFDSIEYFRHKENNKLKP